MLRQGGLRNKSFVGRVTGQVSIEISKVEGRKVGSECSVFKG